MKRIKTKKSDKDPRFPFILGCELDETDMELLNEPLIPDIVKSNHGKLICSSADESDGMGNLIIIPFDEIIELGRNEEGDLFVDVKNTEGETTYNIIDFRIINY